MPLKPLLNGYSGALQIGQELALCASFNLSMQENYIKSNGIMKPIYSDGKFKKLSNMVIRDYPLYEIDATIEATENILKQIFKVFSDGVRTKYKVKFDDTNNRISYDFQDCHLQSFSLNVSENSILQSTVKFIYFKNKITFDYDLQSELEQYGNSNKADNIAGDNKLIPYWKTSLQGILEKDDVVQFSLTWNQDIVPIYGCNNGGTKPAQPKLLKFGIPTMSFNATYICGSSHSFDNKDTKQPDIVNEITAKFGSEKLKLYHCLIITFSPILANRSSYVGYEIQGQVLGKIEKG